MPAKASRKYHVQTRWGESEDSPSKKRMKEILAELETEDPEHPDTWLTHESGWTLSVHESGLVVLENPESDEEPKHLPKLSRSHALGLWVKLAKGKLDELAREPWTAGYPLSHPQERKDKVEPSWMAEAREFYEQLGAERPERPCKREGCHRGSVQFSVLCRVHQYESVRGSPCPFDD